jgi:hypothetical protein
MSTSVKKKDKKLALLREYVVTTWLPKYCCHYLGYLSIVVTSLVT